MSDPFDINQYVDLSQVSDPRLKAEITRTLEYFATKEEGRMLLRDAKTMQGHRIAITEDLKAPTACGGLDGSVNINPFELEHMQVFTTPEKIPHHTKADSLPDALWHELEHARTSKGSITSSKEITLSKEVDKDEEALLRAGEKEYLNSSNARSHSSPEDISVLDVRIMKEFNDYAVARQLREGNHAPFTLSPHNPDWLKNEGVRFYDAFMEKTAEHDRTNEDPVIARTNEAMKLYYSDDKPRYSHSGILTAEPHAINSGTLSPQQQALEDAQHYAEMNPTMKANFDSITAEIEKGYTTVAKTYADVGGATAPYETTPQASNTESPMPSAAPSAPEPTKTNAAPENQSVPAKGPATISAVSKSGAFDFSQFADLKASMPTLAFTDMGSNGSSVPSQNMPDMSQPSQSAGLSA